MMEAVRTSETSVDNQFTRQYNPEDSSEHIQYRYINRQTYRQTDGFSECCYHYDGINERLNKFCIFKTWISAHPQDPIDLDSSAAAPNK
jgi:hypothetical protein